jgi:hypothetical protein
MIMIILIILPIMITKKSSLKPRLLGGEDVKLTVGNMSSGVTKSIIATNLTVEAATSGKQTRYTRVQG